MNFALLRDTAANRRLLICIATGFSSGLPLYVLLNLVPAWLRSEGVDLKAIGLLTLIQLPYTWKFLWSPLVDRYSWGRFGRRRSWMLATQIGLIVAIAALGSVSPTQILPTLSGESALLHFFSHPVTLLALLTALCSATQDIALDAYRRELLLDQELGLGSSINVAAYRIAGLVPGSLSLILADSLPWSQVFTITALFMLPGVALTLAIKEPTNTLQLPRTLRAAAIEPLREFIGRAGWRYALWILAFMFCYKLGDALCTTLATPFYLDMGYSKKEIGIVAKNAGLWGSVIGGLIGGLWMLRLGINRALWIFGFAQILSILGFAWLAGNQANIGAAATDAAHLDTLVRLIKLGAVVGVEAFGVGVGTAALAAFILAQTNRTYAATQFALFSSFMVVPRTLISASAGYLVDALGWTQFYLLCFALAVPGMLMLFKVAPWRAPITT